MTVRSIIDIEINGEEFKQFKASFEEYRKRLAEMPNLWGNVNEGIQANKESFSTIAALMLTQESITRRLLLQQRESNQTVERTSTLWGTIANSTGRVAANLLSATTTLLRWGSLTSVLTGIVGGGGLFGLDRLAGQVGSGRRSSQGLGLKYGEQQSFENNFQRLIDSRGFLSGVNDSLTDYSKRVSLYGAGLTEKDIAGHDTGQVAVSALQSLKQLADKTPDAGLQQLIQSRQLGGLVSVEDLRRLKATSGSEFQSIVGGYGKRAGEFDLNDPTQRAWQDLAIQFQNSWTRIENSFVKGLTGLAGPLTKLGDAFSEATSAFLANPHLKEWIDEFGKGIESVGRYLGSEEFQQDLSKFGGAIKSISSYVSALLPSTSEDINPQWKSDIIPAEPPDPWQTLLHGPSKAPGANNPGNLRDPKTGGFASFTSPEAGVRRMGWQLQRDEYTHGLSTLRQLIGDESWGWAPASDHNDVNSYVKNVARDTGIDPDAKLNLKDQQQLASVIAAITKQEGRQAYDRKVVVEILNNTGGNVVTSVSQLPQ